MKKNRIAIDISLDEQKVPQAIEWSNQQDDKTQQAKAMLLSFFDIEHRDTFKIDLWTKEMQVIEMDRFFYQTLRGLADTYFRATQNKELASDMQRFVQYFGEKTEVIPKN